MSNNDKGMYYRALKAAGVPFSKHYREYTAAELQQAYEKLAEGGEAPPLDPTPPPQSQPRPPAAAPRHDQAPDTRNLTAPMAARNPDEVAGARLNSKEEWEPIRVDPETGAIWFQEEVRKPAYPKPRARRVLTYLERGVKQQTVHNGQYQETFEVAGDGPAEQAQIKITLPSYQVGIYQDPRFPFKTYCYNGNEGFDLFEVQNYYGGAELVPAEIARKYVENVLCYDIRTVIRAIESEYRQQVLAGKIQ
jgi:hypothetical protein